MSFYDTPRNRRLRTDYEAMKQLKDQSTILEFQAFGDPPERYLFTFRGKGLMRKSSTEPVELAEVHRVEVRLGIDYPRSRPDLQWLTQIYHPNISAVGAVCLGGYSTNWTPSLGLDELNTMLWDMVRYANYDPKSAYNYEAGRWCESQTQWDFPVDPRPIRDKIGQTVGDNVVTLEIVNPTPTKEAPPITPEVVEEDIMVIDDQTRPEPPPRPARPRDEDILIIE